MLCEQLAENFLVSTHLQAFATGASTKAAVGSLLGRLREGQPFRFDYVKASGKLKDGTPANDYEKSLLASFSNRMTASPTTSEFAEVDSLTGGTYTYYKVIRASEECIECHRLTSNGEIAVGDMLAILKIEVD